MYKTLLLCVVFFLMLLNCTNNKQDKNPLFDHEKICCKNNLILQEHFLAKIENENIVLQNIDEFLDDKNKEIVIARVFGNYCGTCVDSIFSTLSRIFEEENFIVLSSDISPRYLKYKFENNFVDIENNEIKIPTELKQMPYLFYYDKDKIAKHIMIVDKVSLGMLDEYC